MARIRTIKPAYFDDAQLATISRDARYTMIGILVNADDFGNVKGNLHWLRSRIFPYEDIDSKHFEKWVRELQSIRMIIPYVMNGEEYYHIRGFTKHQRVDKANIKDRNPAPPPHAIDNYEYQEPIQETHKKREYSPRGYSPEVHQLVEEFIDALRLSDANIKATASFRWLDQMNLLLTKDKRSVEEVRRVIEFATTDSFWKGNILSVPSLREKFTQLLIKSNAKHSNSNNNRRAVQSISELANDLRGHSDSTTTTATAVTAAVSQ